MYGNFISATATIAISTITGNIFVFTVGQITFGENTTVNATGGPVVCYAKGTKILTKNGYKRIEHIGFNDKIVTKKNAPVCIKVGALGENAPFEDLYVSPDHGIIINGKIIAAKRLINHRSIFQDVEYYHLELESHRWYFRGILFRLW